MTTFNAIPEKPSEMYLTKFNGWKFKLRFLKPTNDFQTRQSVKIEKKHKFSIVEIRIFVSWSIYKLIIAMQNCTMVW